MVLESWWRYASGCQQEPTKDHEVASPNFFSTPCRSQAAPVPGRRWASWCEAPTSWWLRRRSAPSTMPSVSFAALSKKGQLPRQTLLVVLDLWQRRSCTDSSCRSVTNRGRVMSECSPLIQSLLSGQPGRGALTHKHYSHNESTNRCLFLFNSAASPSGHLHLYLLNFSSVFLWLMFHPSGLWLLAVALQKLSLLYVWLSTRAHWVVWRLTAYGHTATHLK